MTVYTRSKKLNTNTKSTPTNINDLSLDILKKIVWLLPLKASARTSILSKQWSDLWLSNPNLDLSPITVARFGQNELNKFEKVVTNIIFGHTGSIKNVYIGHPNFEGELTDSAVKWIDSLAKYHPITDLIFNVGEWNIPPSFFCCKYLVNLELSMHGALITVPNKVILPSLKNISLRRVIFSSSDQFERFLNGCQNLEIMDLFDFNCIWSEELNVKLNLPKLKVFRFDSQYDFVYIYLSARKLEILDFRGKHLIVEASLSEIKEVERIEIEQWIRPYLNRRRDNNLWQFGEKMSDTLHALSKTKTLSLGVWCTEHLTTIADTVKLPVFWNLKQLQVSIMPNTHHAYMVLYLLKRSVFLESLKVETCECICHEIYLDQQRDDYPEPPHRYQGIYVNLKHIEMRNFMGTYEELHLVESLLNSCPMLETLDIRFALRVKQYVRRRVRVKVPKFPRFSNSVEITIGNAFGWG